MRRLALLSLFVLPGFATAAGLTIGSAAPTLKIETMLKGKAVDLSHGVHVVEFWATWCGPCKMNIPHLTELAHKYKGRVQVTGIDIWEQGVDKLGQARRFVQSEGAAMDYNIAFDGDAKAMDAGFMKAADQHGIPTAFLIKDGKVMDIEIGYPMPGLDRAIEGVLAGTYNTAAAKKQFERQKALDAEESRKQAERMKVLKPAIDAFRAKRYDDAVAAFDARASVPAPPFAKLYA